jgi:hypothetical protein
MGAITVMGLEDIIKNWPSLSVNKKVNYENIKIPCVHTYDRMFIMSWGSVYIYILCPRRG